MFKLHMLAMTCTLLCRCHSAMSQPINSLPLDRRTRPCGCGIPTSARGPHFRWGTGGSATDKAATSQTYTPKGASEVDDITEKAGDGEAAAAR